MRLTETDPALTAALERRGRQWRGIDGTARLWARDGSLWTDSGEEDWLGWLDLERLGHLTIVDADGKPADTEAAKLAGHLAGPPFDRCLLLGMGGSALGAGLLWRALPRQVEADFIVLDTTDPREIAAALEGVDPGHLRVIAASKSGGTLETRLAFELLLDRLGDAASASALAITDPGSALETRARDAGVRVVFGRPDIGGRFSVLSAFGLAPAAVAGIDVEPLLLSARRMAAACRRPDDGAETNPGVELGLLLAAAHDCGRDKLYLHAPDGFAEMVAWVEQLLAESLGKGDVLLLPVAAAGLPAESAPDRLDIELSPADLGGEFFRWQFATAVAGALLGVNPFDQPDVESSKVVTRRFVERMKAGDAPAPGGVVRLSEVSELGLDQLLGTHFATFPDRGYAVTSAYLDRSHRNRELLDALRRGVAGRTGGASVLGFGPSFLHSTGQAHKGGPNRGLFLQITADPPAADVPIPGEGLTFGQVELAQAWGDYEVLVERDRRVLAVHIDGEVEAGLRRLIEALG
ncbi:MAG: hypothetical protein F4060_01755 [Holophagales bacterium]|nr:hypothetical protein [Holophagales bacterium]MYG29966.1 hypothetical protein [Holophagales bacterium]MYI78645.1 hypothetical protein [Holophagales bacterium]